MGNLGTETDFFSTHIPNAKDLIKGVFPNYGAKMPLYSALVAFMHFFYKDWFVLGKFISIVSSIGALSIIYKFLYKVLYGKQWVAFASVLLISTNYWFFKYSYEATYDMPFFFLCLLSLFFLFNKGVGNHILLASLFAVLASLMRTNGLFLLPVIIIHILLMRKDNLSLVYRPLLGSMAVFGIIYGAWTLVKYYFTSSLTTTNIRFIIREFYPNPDIQSQITGLFTLITYDFGHFLSFYLGRVLNIIKRDWSELLSWPLSAVIFVGIAFNLRRLKQITHKRIFAVLVANMALSMLLLALFHYEHRYSFAHVYFYPIIGLMLIDQWLETTKFKYKLPLILVIVGLFIFNVGTTPNKVKRDLNSEPTYLHPFANYLREHRQINREVIMARKPHIGYYADLKWVFLKPRIKTMDMLLKRAKEVNASYLLYSVIEAHSHPQFRSLFNPKTQLPHLIPIAYTRYGILYAFHDLLEP